MRNRTLWILALLAVVMASPLLAAEEAAPEVSADLPEMIVPGDNTTSCDSTPADAPEVAGDTLELVLDGTHGAQNLEDCWTEPKHEYTCTCLNNTRVRHKYYERNCCSGTGCGGWVLISNTCSGTLCGP